MLISCATCLVVSFEFSTLSTDLKWLVVLNLIICGLVLINEKSIELEVSLLFIGTFSFFLLSRIILTIIGSYDLSKTNFFTSYSFDALILGRLYCVLNLALTGFIVGVRSRGNRSYKRLLARGPSGIVVYYAFLLIGCVLCLYAAYLSIISILNSGYIAAFKEGSKVSELLLFITRVVAFIATSLTLYLKKKRSHIFIIGICTLVFLLSDGRRGPGLCYAIGLSFLYLKTFKVKIRFWQLTVFSITILYLAIYVGNLRYASNSASNLVLMDFFYGQGISIQNIGYAIKLNDSLSYSIIDIFNPVAKFIYDSFTSLGLLGSDFGGQSDIVESFKVYSLYLSSIVNPRLFGNGFGMGGCYLAELYSAGGIIAIFMFNFLLSRFIGFFLKKSDNIVAFRITLLPFIANVIYLPRNNIGSLLLEMLIYLIVGLVLNLLYRLK